MMDKGQKSFYQRGTTPLPTVVAAVIDMFYDFSIIQNTESATIEIENVTRF